MSGSRFFEADELKNKKKLLILLLMARYMFRATIESSEGGADKNLDYFWEEVVCVFV
jgi:hypothetical protein